MPNAPGGTGVQKRFSDKERSRRVKFHGSEHALHMKDGERGVGGKDGKVQYANIGTPNQFGPDKGEKSYPSLHVGGDKLSELHQHAVGDPVEMNVKGSLKEHRIDDKGKHHFNVEVTHAAVKK